MGKGGRERGREEEEEQKQIEEQEEEAEEARVPSMKYGRYFQQLQNLNFSELLVPWPFSRDKNLNFSELF